MTYEQLGILTVNGYRSTVEMMSLPLVRRTSFQQYHVVNVLMMWHCWHGSNFQCVNSATCHPIGVAWHETCTPANPPLLLIPRLSLLTLSLMYSLDNSMWVSSHKNTWGRIFTLVKFFCWIWVGRNNWAASNKNLCTAFYLVCSVPWQYWALKLLFCELHLVVYSKFEIVIIEF